MIRMKVVKFRWFAMLTLAIASIAQGMVLIAPAPLIGELVKVLHISLGEATGAMMGPFILSVALAAIVGGIIIDRFGLAVAYFISLIMMIVGSLLVLVIGDSLVGLIVVRVIQGFGCGPVIGSTPKLAAEWFPQKERPLVSGLQGASLSVGIAMGFAVAPAVFAKTGNWKIALAAMAGAVAIALIVNIIYALGPSSPHQEVPELKQDCDLADAIEFKKILKLPVFWVGVLSAFLLSWAMQGYNDITPGHLAIESPVGLGLGPVVAGEYMGMLQLAFMVGAVVSGFVVQRVFKGVHRYTVSLSFILTGLFCISVLFPVVMHNQQLLKICLILAGFFMGMPQPTTVAFVAAVYPEHLTGRIGGATMGLAILGGVAGVVAGSVALHISGMYTISIFVVGIICVLGFINGFWLRPPQGVFEQ